MKEHNQPSQSPNKFDNLHTWYSCYPFTSNFRTSTQREESIHFHPDNTPNAAKYWFKAAKLAAQ